MPEATATNHGKVLDRMARVRCVQFLVMLLGFNLVSGVLRNTVSVYAANREKAVELAHEEEQLAAVRRRRDELQRRKRFCQSEDGIIAAARPLGLGRPGEIKVMFDQAPPPPPPAPAQPAGAAPTKGAAPKHSAAPAHGAAPTVGAAH